MKTAYIYTRTFPSDTKVDRSENRLAQQKRGAIFLRLKQIKLERIFSDQGEMHPIRFLPQFNVMLHRLKYEDKAQYVYCDDIKRLGHTPEIQQYAIQMIKNAGGTFICPKQKHNEKSLLLSILENIKEFNNDNA